MLYFRVRVVNWSSEKPGQVLEALREIGAGISAREASILNANRDAVIRHPDVHELKDKLRGLANVSEIHFS